MKKESIEILEKNNIGRSTTKETASTGCCGGAPTNNNAACCKLDEDKKAAGESGCGCNTTTVNDSGSGCC